MPESSPEPGKVLVIDDSFIMRRVLRNALEQLGITNIIEAEDAHAALALITEHPVRIILADWNMPNMDGLSLLKIIRSEEETKDIPFVMITGRNTKEDIQDAILLGVDDYLLKPVKAYVLQQKLARFLPELQEKQRKKKKLKPRAPEQEETSTSPSAKEATPAPEEPAKEEVEASQQTT